MADLINLAAESGRNIIGDDSSPTLNLENTSSGECIKLQNAGGTGTNVSTISCPTTSVYVVSGGVGADISGGAEGAVIKSTATESNPLDVVHGTAVGSATVAAIRVTASAASGPAFEIRGGSVISTASAGVTIAFGVRVKFGDVYGWLPAYTEIDA